MKTLFILTGPTGVGKTQIALQLATRAASPIINADSRQIYREIPLGTAAPTAEDQARIKHYFVGTKSVKDYYSAAEFERDVMALLPSLFKQHNVVVMTGGSMMYIDAVCHGIDDMPTVGEELRNELQQRLKNEGLDALLSELRLLDPEYYKEVDHKNTRRIMHALEICYQTGYPFSSFRTNQKKIRPFNVVKVGLWRERTDLFCRINQRAEKMLEAGWLQEVEQVKAYREYNALNTVGYKELFKVIDGEWELPFALARLQKNTRVYAKKQITWLKKDPDVQWVHADEAHKAVQLIDALYK